MLYMNEKLVLRSVVAMLVFLHFSYTCCLAIHAAAVERFLSPLCLNKYPILWDCSPPCSISFWFFSFVYWSVDKISFDCCYSTASNCAKRWVFSLCWTKILMKVKFSLKMAFQIFWWWFLSLSSKKTPFFC